MHALRQGHLARHPGLLLLSSVCIPGIQEPPDLRLTHDGLGATVSTYWETGTGGWPSCQSEDRLPLSHMDQGTCPTQVANIELLSFCEIFPINVLKSEREGICLSEQRSDVDVAQAGCGCWSPH